MAIVSFLELGNKKANETYFVLLVRDFQSADRHAEPPPRGLTVYIVGSFERC